MARRTFVTGATGFIGRLLVDDLVANGWTVAALVRPTSDTRHLEELGVELIVGDLTTGPAFADAIASADTIFHLAAATFARGEAEYRAANETGTRALVDAALTASPRPRRLVYLSSYAAIGPANIGEPRAHDALPGPLTAYGRSKLAGERITYDLATAGVDVVIVRAPVVYGPGDRALLPYYRIVRWGFAPAPGGSDRRLHLVFGPDLASALRRAADVPTGTYAVAEPVEHRWTDVARSIATALGRRPVSVPLPSSLVRAAARVTETVGRRAGKSVAFNREKAEEMLAPAWICDLAGAELLLPFDSVTPLDVGVGHTVRWYLRQGWL